MRGGVLGRDFAWLWRAYAISTLGTWLAFDAFPLIAILALHVGAAWVSLIAAVGGAAGALLAVPLGPWVEYRPKRRLMIRADLVRFLVLLTVPVAYVAGVLRYPQLLAVVVVVAVCDIVFRGAAGAHLKTLVPGRHLMEANARFETVTWISTAVGPPTGGALIGLLGPVVTVIIDAVSYLLSALGLRAIAAPEAAPPVRAPGGSRLAEAGAGWRAIAADRVLRSLFAYNVLVSALIMATAPLLAFLMLHDLGFSTLEYGLAFGIPCLGGIAGARASRPLVSRYGRRRILLGFGVARTLPPVFLAFMRPGLAGLLLVIVVELILITCMGVFNPVLATERLERAGEARTARVLTAWTISSRTAIAVLTALWGVLAALAGARTAIAVAGLLLAATSVLLPWRSGGGDAGTHGPLSRQESEPVDA